MLFEKYKTSRLSKDATHFTNLYIDTTMIKNLAGRDCTGGNPTDRGRLATKVSIIIDKNKIPVSEPVFYPANKNDISTIEGTIDKMPFDLRIDGRRTGDKAYRSKVLARTILLTKKIRIVAQPKKNEKHARSGLGLCHEHVLGGIEVSVKSFTRGVSPSCWMKRTEPSILLVTRRKTFPIPGVRDDGLGKHL
jgi:hypothetical protein